MSKLLSAIESRVEEERVHAYAEGISSVVSPKSGEDAGTGFKPLYAWKHEQSPFYRYLDEVREKAFAEGVAAALARTPEEAARIEEKRRALKDRIQNITDCIIFLSEERDRLYEELDITV